MIEADEGRQDADALREAIAEMVHRRTGNAKHDDEWADMHPSGKVYCYRVADGVLSHPVVAARLRTVPREPERHHIGGTVPPREPASMTPVARADFGVPPVAEPSEPDALESLWDAIWEYADAQERGTQQEQAYAKGELTKAIAALRAPVAVAPEPTCVKCQGVGLLSIGQPAEESMTCDACNGRGRVAVAETAERTLLVEALRFYADIENWDNDDWGVRSVIQPEYGNAGKRARQVLAALAAPAPAPRLCPHVGCTLPEPHEHMSGGPSAVPAQEDAL